MLSAEHTLRKLYAIDEDAAYRAIGDCLRHAYQDISQSGLVWPEWVEILTTRLERGEGPDVWDKAQIPVLYDSCPSIFYNGRTHELIIAMQHLQIALAQLSNGRGMPGAAHLADALTELAHANAICDGQDHLQLSYEDIHDGREMCLPLILRYIDDLTLLGESRLRTSLLAN